MGTWTYHTSHSYKNKDGKEVTCMTQLYKIGVYLIVNNDPSMQGGSTPGKMVTLEKILKERERKGEISDLVFGREITVSDDTGLFVEVKT